LLPLGNIHFGWDCLSIRFKIFPALLLGSSSTNR